MIVGLAQLASPRRELSSVVTVASEDDWNYFLGCNARVMRSARVKLAARHSLVRPRFISARLSSVSQFRGVLPKKALVVCAQVR